MDRLRLRKAWLGAITIVLALSVSAALVEGVLRLIQFKYEHAIRMVRNGEDWRDVHMFEDQMFESDDVLLWKPRVSTDYYVTFNRLGYRGKEVAATKAPNELRILAVGDSNTLGPAEYSWPEFLQNAADLRCAQTGTTVVNAGVYGYTTFQGARRFEEGLQYQPDFVLVAFGWNDVAETTNPPDKAYGAQTLRFAAVKRFMAKNSRLYQLFRSTSDRLGGHMLSDVGTGGLRSRVSLDDYRSNLSQIVSRARKDGVLPVLLTRPHILDATVDRDPIRSWRKKVADYNNVVREVARDFHIPIVDAYAMFADRRHYFIDDNHLTEAGARLLADRVYSVISTQTDKCSDYTFDETSVDYQNSDVISLKVSPLQLKAGRDSYDVWIEGEKFPNTSVTIQYDLNNGPLKEFVVGLDTNGKGHLPVPSTTARGRYHFNAFRPAGYGYYIRSDITLTVQ